jgi:hypothetical protein
MEQIKEGKLPAFGSYGQKPKPIEKPVYEINGMRSLSLYALAYRCAKKQIANYLFNTQQDSTEYYSEESKWEQYRQALARHFPSKRARNDHSPVMWDHDAYKQAIRGRAAEILKEWKGGD